jgi:hypothetical protein
VKRTGAGSPIARSAMQAAIEAASGISFSRKIVGISSKNSIAQNLIKSSYKFHES